MNRISWWGVLIALGLSVQAADQPNIILIMGDDMGVSDIGCYGSEIKTPALDALADQGLRFTQFYNASRCCPTRAALMSSLSVLEPANIPSSPVNVHAERNAVLAGAIGLIIVGLGVLLVHKGTGTW